MVTSEIEIDEWIVGAFYDIRNGEHENECRKQENAGVQHESHGSCRKPCEKALPEKSVAEQKFETREAEEKRSQQKREIFR